MLLSALRRRYRKHEETLDHIAELEQELGLAEPTTGATHAPFGNVYSGRVFDIRGATIAADAPAQQKPEPFVPPVLDDHYFERRRPTPFLSASQYHHYGMGSVYGGASYTSYPTGLPYVYDRFA